MTGLLYDVHGNLLALEAVLADAEAAGVRRFVLGGDYGMAGAWPRECVERLRELDATWIRGNVDRWCANPDDAPDVVQPLIARCRELLGPETVDELGALPEQAVLDGARYCHASPASDLQSFFPERRDNEAELLGGVEERRLVFGHTHVQFRRRNGIELVNPGSVGAPWDGDRRAAYALVAPDGEVELRRVEYDWQAAADAIRERLGDAGEIPAKRVEQARFDVA